MAPARQIPEVRTIRGTGTDVRDQGVKPPEAGSVELERHRFLPSDSMVPILVTPAQV